MTIAVFDLKNYENEITEVRKKYVEYFDPSFVGIKLDDGDLEKITKRVGVYYKKISTQDGVNFFDHTGAIFVINKSSKIIGLYTPPITIDLMKEDILYGLR